MSNSLRAYLCGKYWFSHDPYNEQFPLKIMYFSSDGIAIKLTYDSWYKDTAELFVWSAEDAKLIQMFLHDMRRQESEFDIVPSKDGGGELNLKLTVGQEVFYGTRYIEELAKKFPSQKIAPRIQIDHQGLLNRLNSVQKMYGDTLGAL